MKQEFEYSFWGVGVNVLGYAFFVGMFTWLVLDRGDKYSPYLMIGVGILVLGFVYGFIQSISQLTSSKPAVELDNDGLTINLTGFDPYYLKWEEIDYIQKDKRILKSHITFKSGNPKEVISKQPWYNKIHFYLNKLNAGEYFIIPMDCLSSRSAGTLDDAHQTLLTYWKKTAQPIAPEA